MSMIEDFRNAPVGATARRKGSARVWKERTGGFPWATTFHYEWLSNEELVEEGYMLGLPAPTTAREALDLAWELAHEVKEGQVIPEGTRLLDRPSHSHFSAYMTRVDLTINEWESQTIRTLEPLPDPEPDWLDAPAVLATCECRGIELWQPHNEKDGMWVSVSGEHARWTSLRDVTPLYPKGAQK